MCARLQWRTAQRIGDRPRAPARKSGPFAGEAVTSAAANVATYFPAVSPLRLFGLPPSAPLHPRLTGVRTFNIKSGLRRRDREAVFGFEGGPLRAIIQGIWAFGQAPRAVGSRSSPEPTRQRAKDEFGALGDTGLGQHDHFVTERWIHEDQSMVFGNCFIQTMPTLGVGHINLGPWWR